VQSGLHRRIENQFKAIGDPSNLEDKQKQLREEYRSVFYLFTADALSMLEPEERNVWGILFAMQHHRVPTRLLDWTESFACAFFFAQLERDGGEDAAVFVLKTDELNRISTGQEGLISVIEDPAAETNVPIADWLPNYFWPAEHPPLKAVAIVPHRTNPRMMAQRAAFTICGDSVSPMEEEYSSCVVKIHLPSSLFDDVEAFLEIVGVGPSTYFPDLEGLAMYFQAKHHYELRYARRILQHDLP